MPERYIPSDVLALLHGRIAGLDELEVLLFVRKRAPLGASTDDVSERLGLPTSSSEAALEGLCAAKLLVARHVSDVDPNAATDAVGGEGRVRRRFVYQPETPELEGAVSSLVVVYDERRLEVMRILSNNALDRIRSAAARTFADAFVIGGHRSDQDGGKKKGS